MKGRKDLPQYEDKELEMALNYQCAVVLMLFSSEDNQHLLTPAPTADSPVSGRGSCYDLLC